MFVNDEGHNSCVPIQGPPPLEDVVYDAFAGHVDRDGQTKMSVTLLPSSGAAFVTGAQCVGFFSAWDWKEALVRRI